MGFPENKYLAVIFIFSMFILSISAMRPLEGDHWLQTALVIQSLQRGPVPPSRSSPCTYIPGRGRGRCTLGEINYAGRSSHATRGWAFADLVIEFASASMAPNETQKQDSSS